MAKKDCNKGGLMYCLTLFNSKTDIKRLDNIKKLSRAKELAEASNAVIATIDKVLDSEGYSFAAWQFFKGKWRDIAVDEFQLLAA